MKTEYLGFPNNIYELMASVDLLIFWPVTLDKLSTIYCRIYLSKIKSSIALHYLPSLWTECLQLTLANIIGNSNTPTIIYIYISKSKCYTWGLGVKKSLFQRSGDVCYWQNKENKDPPPSCIKYMYIRPRKVKGRGQKEKSRRIINVKPRPEVIIIIKKRRNSFE